MVGVPINHYQPLFVFHGMGIGTLSNTWLNMLLSLADTVHVCHYDIHIHPGGPGTGPWLLKNSCFAVAPARFHVGNNHEKKTSVLVWFATLAGFCASKPGERSKWPFLFTAWEILQLRQWRSASRSQCVPISIGDFECIWTTNHCVCLGLGNECCLELTFSSISSSAA